jgi:hypothetical protein
MTVESHPWPPPLEDRFRQDVAACGLEDSWPRLRALARPCYTVVLGADAGLDRPGASRLGGLPDLPPGRPGPTAEAGC